MAEKAIPRNVAKMEMRLEDIFRQYQEMENENRLLRQKVIELDAKLKEVTNGKKDSAKETEQKIN